MRSIKMSVSKKKFLVLAIASLITLGSSSFFLLQEKDSSAFSSDPSSSELGIAAFSPLGESGGLVVPASCPSDIHNDPWYGQPCTSDPNACGQTQSGTYQCGGTCLAWTCANGAESCTSDQAICNMAGATPGACSVGPPPVPYDTAWCQSIGWDYITDQCAGYCACNAGRTYVDTTDPIGDGRGGSCQAVASPTLSVSASPTSVSSGGSSTITWSTTNATSCYSWVSSGSGTWEGWVATGGSANETNITSARTSTFECWNSIGVSTGQKSVTVTVTAAPINGLCSSTHYNCSAGVLGSTAEYADQYQWWCNGLNGGSNALCSEMKAVPVPVLHVCPAGATMAKGEIRQFKAWYDASGAAINCSTVPGGATDVTSSANWTSANATIASVGNSSSPLNKGIVTGNNAGSANITATYNSKSKIVSVNVIAVCSPDCSAASDYCSGTSFSDANGCGTNNCTGTRSCDFNWREVAP